MTDKKEKVGGLTLLFFGILFLIMALIGIFVPGLTSEGIEIHPLYSQMDMETANAIHILGNVFFAVIAIYIGVRLGSQISGFKSTYKGLKQKRSGGKKRRQKNQLTTRSFLTICCCICCIWS